MSHWAELDLNRIVKRVIVAEEDYIMSGALGNPRNWMETSYNSNFRKNYAGVGYYYDYGKNAFIAPKPFNSWILNEDTCRWEAPVAYPADDTKPYTWDEESLSWKPL